MKFSLLVFSAILGSVSTVLAAPASTSTVKMPTSSELREMARKEAASEGVLKRTASDAQIDNAGILQLQDPGLADRTSPWRWMAGLRFQSITPGGEATMNNGQRLDLDAVGATILPVLGFGVQRQLSVSDASVWGATLGVEAGYTSQDTQVTYPSGVRPQDTRLSTGTLAGVLGVTARFARLPSLEWRGALASGMMTLSHSAPDNSVNFTKQGRFFGPRLGISYWPNALVALDLTAETVENTVATKSGNVSFGTRVTW